MTLSVAFAAQAPFPESILVTEVCGGHNIGGIYKAWRDDKGNYMKVDTTPNVAKRLVSALLDGDTYTAEYPTYRCFINKGQPNECQLRIRHFILPFGLRKRAWVLQRKVTDSANDWTNLYIFYTDRLSPIGNWPDRATMTDQEKEEREGIFLPNGNIRPGSYIRAEGTGKITLTLDPEYERALRLYLAANTEYQLPRKLHCGWICEGVDDSIPALQTDQSGDDEKIDYEPAPRPQLPPSETPEPRPDTSPDAPKGADTETRRRLRHSPGATEAMWQAR